MFSLRTRPGFGYPGLVEPGVLHSPRAQPLGTSQQMDLPWNFASPRSLMPIPIWLDNADLNLNKMTRRTMCVDLSSQLQDDWVSMRGELVE